jgi:hypothetical protein
MFLMDFLGDPVSLRIQARMDDLDRHGFKENRSEIDGIVSSGRYPW